MWDKMVYNITPFIKNVFQWQILAVQNAITFAPT